MCPGYTQTYRQTDRKGCIWAHRAICTDGPKKVVICDNMPRACIAELVYIAVMNRPLYLLLLAKLHYNVILFRYEINLFYDNHKDCNWDNMPRACIAELVYIAVMNRPLYLLLLAKLHYNVILCRYEINLFYDNHKDCNWETWLIDKNIEDLASK